MDIPLSNAFGFRSVRCTTNEEITSDEFIDIYLNYEVITTEVINVNLVSQ